MAKAAKKPKTVEALKHDEAKRKNIPTAEYQAVVQKEQQSPVKTRYPRNRDLDPQLVWRGKDEQDWSDLVVNAPPLYIQEKVHPKVLVDDLLRTSREASHAAGESTPDLFADFNGIPLEVDKTEFYQHDQNWSNRMILGDSLQVMASLAEREGLRGKVQCIYFDPPYGIKFNSNFQWSTTSRDVKDGKADHITREPEQVKAFRDTWRDGIHSYLTYLRDRLTVARDLLTDSGSIFVQIGDENVHRVRALMDEVFGDANFCSLITFRTAVSTNTIYNISDYLIWYSKNSSSQKRRVLFDPRPEHKVESTYNYEDSDGVRFKATDEVWGRNKAALFEPFQYLGKKYPPPTGKGYKWGHDGMRRLAAAARVEPIAGRLYGRKLPEDFPVMNDVNLWQNTATSTFSADKIYVVQTNWRVVEHCMQMVSDPGDLVLDPTCGSGTTAYVAEQWGRRWITIDTSRVALALARARIMGARYPFYLLADSRDGQLKEAEVTRTAPSSQPVRGNIRHGFVYERVPHITLKSIANNAEIDVIWDKWQQELEPLREQLNSMLGKQWQEWEIPREPDKTWQVSAQRVHAAWWDDRIARQKEIGASIAAKAEFEYL